MSLFNGLESQPHYNVLSPAFVFRVVDPTTKVLWCKRFGYLQERLFREKGESLYVHLYAIVIVVLNFHRPR